MKKILFLLLMIILSTGNVFAGISGAIIGKGNNRVTITTTTYLATTGTLVKRGQGEIWNLNFTATAANGAFSVCDSISTGACSAQGGVVAEGQQSVSGNSYTLSYGDLPLQIQNGIEIVVTNGDLTVSYD